MGINRNHTPTHYDMSTWRRCKTLTLCLPQSDIFTNISNKMILISAAGSYAHKCIMLTHELNCILMNHTLHCLNATLAIYVCMNDAYKIQKAGCMSSKTHV